MSDYSEHLIAARKALLDAEKAAMMHDWVRAGNEALEAMKQCASMGLTFEALNATNKTVQESDERQQISLCRLL